MRIYNKRNLTDKELSRLFKRSASDIASVIEQVRPILSDVKQNGDKAVMKYARKFDHLSGASFLLTSAERRTAERKLDKATRNAINEAAANIETFHSRQIPQRYSVETMPGILCWREFLPMRASAAPIPKNGNSLIK